MVQNRMSCVPTLTTWLMRQSNEASASSSFGQPVSPVCQRAAAKRSAIGVLPPNRVESGSCPALSVFTHRVRFSVNVGQTEAPRFKHTSRVGGESVTLHTALAVKPACPAGPSVVIILTAAPTQAIASRKVCTSRVLMFAPYTSPQASSKDSRGRRPYSLLTSP
ncbi:hypothetical protein D3C80_833640 [compost metagenome]